MEFISDHLRIDMRSLALHRQVAAKLRANSALVTQAEDNLARWRAQNGTEPWMVEWEAILNWPISEIVAFLCDAGQLATRLRQSSPFTGILTPEERRVIYEAARNGAYDDIAIAPTTAENDRL